MTARTLPPPRELAENLRVCADCLDVLRESGQPLPNLSEAVNTLERVATAAQLYALSLHFLGKVGAKAELLTVALQCRSLADDVDTVFPLREGVA